MGKVIIMSGVSGSGKSKYALDLTLSPEAMRLQKTAVVSADNFFYELVEGSSMRGSEYKFDPSRLSDAHGECFRHFIIACQGGFDLVVVDNTNTTSEEIAPYILGAQAYGYEVEIITLRCKSVTDLNTCYERNRHNVNAMVIAAQSDRLVRRNLMPWWKNTDIDVGA